MMIYILISVFLWLKPRHAFTFNNIQFTIGYCAEALNSKRFCHLLLFSVVSPYESNNLKNIVHAHCSRKQKKYVKHSRFFRLLKQISNEALDELHVLKALKLL
jgi:hypothetical protein